MILRLPMWRNPTRCRRKAYKFEDATLVSDKGDKSTLILYPLGKADDTYQVPESVTTIYQWAFCDVGLLKHPYLPSKLNKIEKEAFYICDGPEDLILPESLTQLEPYSLSNCQIENVVLPSTMQDDWFILCNTYGWYSGKPYLPGVVRNFDTMPYGMREGRDYTIQYKNNAEPGTATATVQGMGIIEGKWASLKKKVK